MRRFDARGLRTVARALDRAERLTAGFYCIPGREWPRYPYEVTTRVGDPGPEGPAFADVVRLAAPPGLGRRMQFPRRFRIRLHDENILAAVHDRADGVALEPLLLFVLTHELVHVVRFGGGFAPFDAEPPERVAEEARVHAVTRRVLDGAPDAGLERVLELYRDVPLELMDSGAVSPK